MSVPRRRRIIIEETARLDIQDILLYTREHWGIEQRHRYRRQLSNAMHALIDHPERGRPRDEYFPGCRSIVMEQHVIFYRLTNEEIIIGRVLHHSQDASGKVHP
jgi:toxin ParE1/3/4